METNPDDPHSLDLAARWIATHPAVERTTQAAAAAAAGTSILESLVHPAYPFVGVGVRGGGDLAAGLRALAEAYLTRVRDALPEARVFETERWPTAVIPWDWYDLGPYAPAPGTPAQDTRLSFWVQVDTATGPPCRTAVLLAGPQFRDSDGQRATGGGEGLRVVLHVDPPDGDGRHFVRITGATFANPPTARQGEQVLSFLGGTSAIERLQALWSRMEETLGPAYALREVSLLPTGVGRFAGRTLGGARDNPRVESWALRVVQAGPGAEPADYSFGYDYRVEEVTHAATPVGAFDRDPASAGPANKMVRRRPTRDSDELDDFLAPAAGRLPPQKSPGDAWLELQDPGPHPRVTVQGTPLAQNTIDPKHLPQRVPTEDMALRSDDQAAVHAYLRGTELMNRLQRSGLTPEAYFRFAKLPLVLRHHAAMKGGSPDGHVVNAQVQPTSAGQDFNAAYDAESRPQLEVRFGAAELRHREAGTAFHGRRRPQYLGLAADPRWAWHEFGHVLSWAATGALEFPFAHSAGDALAAILNDPDSQLAHDGTGPARRNAPAAGLTFPWVPIKRRHDRDASLGWCWCGRRNTRRLSAVAPGARIFTGYFAEQLLSTTLFRLYRALGGDTAVPAVRHKAADYSAYLIMRALWLLGPSTCVAARQATHFFDALVQADVATASWHYGDDATPPGPEATRVGGMAHKLIRWAFEQQGLFATADPQQIVDGIGQPPAVDVHVFGDGSATDGGYGPHALDWTDTPAVTAPGWHADAQGLSVQAGELQFKVCNRGRETAQGVKARAWAAPAAPGTLSWQELTLDPALLAGKDITPGGCRTFGFAATLSGAPLTGPHFLLAAASCSGDRSNLDPLAALPCAGAPPAGPRQVAELVSGDNNIGLVLLDLP